MINGYVRSPHLRLFAGAALISLSPVWVRLVSVAPTASGFYRMLFGSVALILFLAVTGRRLQLSKRAWIILFAGAVVFALDLIFWHRSIVYVGPGLATLLANFQVFFMMLAGLVVLRQRPKPRQVVAVPLALLGLSLIIGLDWSGLPGDYRLGVVFGLLAAVAYAGYLLTLRASRVGSVHASPIREVAVISVICTFILAATLIAEGQSFVIPTVADASWLVAYGILSHCVGWLLIASSLPQVTTTEAGIALLLQPTLSFVWDVVLFERAVTPRELAGASIALIAIYLGASRKAV